MLRTIRRIRGGVKSDFYTMSYDYFVSTIAAMAFNSKILMFFAFSRTNGFEILKKSELARDLVAVHRIAIFVRCICRMETQWAKESRRRIPYGYMFVVLNNKEDTHGAASTTIKSLAERVSLPVPRQSER